MSEELMGSERKKKDTKLHYYTFTGPYWTLLSLTTATTSFVVY
jgi:hypothetical protein